jgi:hypothetical protein
MPSLKLQLEAAIQNFGNDNCTIQVGEEYVCVALTKNSTINAFEFFELESANSITEYHRIFTQSSLLKNKSLNTKVVFNVPDFVVVPNSKFSASCVVNYLATAYGDVDDKLNINCTDDSILSKLNLQVVYRIKAELFEAVNKFCSNAKYQHAVSCGLIDAFGAEQAITEKLHINFYQSSMLVIVILSNKLQLVQSYSYNTKEDIIYYLLNVVQECCLNVQTTEVKISGLIELNSQQFNLLKSIFGKLSVESLNTQPLFLNSISVSNQHYYTPFINAV